MSTLHEKSWPTEPPKSVDILFLCADRIWPVAGGLSARLFALIAHLRAEGWRVGIVCPKHGTAGDHAVAAMVDAHYIYRSAGNEAGRMVQQSPLLVRRALNYLRGEVARARVELRHALPETVKARLIRPLRRSLGTRTPGEARSAPAAPTVSFLAKKLSPGFNKFAHDCVLQGAARVAIAEFAWAAPALAGLPPGVLTIVDTHDIQHLRRRRAQEAHHDLPDRDCSREEEIAALEHGEIMLAIQAGEAETLREMLPEKKVIVAEHALGGAPWHPGAASSQDLLYVGNLYPPNVAGALAFLDGVWPAIRAQVPGARFVVCGKVCEALRDRSDAGLVLEGLVPSLDPYYAAAAIVLNLVPYGTGLKIKTVEALAHGKCTVVTPAGAEGLRVMPTGGLTVVALEAMADTVLRLLRDPAARAAEEAAAWAYAQEHLAPSAVYGELTGVIREHLHR